MWPPWFGEPWHDVTVFYFTRWRKRQRNSLSSNLKLKWCYEKVSVLDILTLYYQKGFIQKFPNSLSLHHYISNFLLKASAVFVFFSPKYTFSSLSDHCPTAHLIQELSFLLKTSSFLGQLANCRGLSCLSSLQSQIECHSVFVLHPMNFQVPCPVNAAGYLRGYRCF